MSNEKDVEELAIEIWAVIDPLGVTKWHTLPEEQREFYRSRAKHLIGLGYRKSPTLACLDRDKVREEVVRIHNQYLLPSGTEIIAVAELNDDIADAICCQFGSPPPIAVVLPEPQDVNVRGIERQMYYEGWNACLEACKKAVSNTVPVPSLTDMNELAMKFTSLNLSTGQCYIDQDVIEPMLKAIRDMMMGKK